jgi:hypothetical protein
VNIQYLAESNGFSITNQGHGNLEFWGMRYFDEPTKFENKPRTLAEGVPFTVRLPHDRDPILELGDQLSEGQRVEKPLDFYVLNQRNQKYAIHALFIVQKIGAKLEYLTQTISCRREEW